MAKHGTVAVVLGDVVGSRRLGTESPAVRRIVEAALDLANERLEAVQPLTPTIGDEFQGIYGDVMSALDATLMVRSALLGEVDVRFGVGSGTLTAFDVDAAPFRQDGPAWWAAREAIELVRDAERRQESPRGLRTRWIDAGTHDAFSVASVNAFILCRDELLAAMDRRDAGTLLGLLADEPLSSIAERQGVSVSALSQRSIRNGLYAIRQAHRGLRAAVEA